MSALTFKLIENMNALNGRFSSRIGYGGNARPRNRLDLLFAEFSPNPRYAIICGVYISENRALVNVIQVNLPRYMSSWVPEILGHTYILPVILGDGS